MRGESSSTLSRAATNGENGTPRRRAGTLSEPLLILMMGALVLIIVPAILLPIFELNTLVR
jgi:general secretion pathway protein F